MDIKDIAKALSTEFRPNDPEHFRLGVWHDGDTLENSSIKISKDLDSGDAFIDILDKKGTGKGTISDIKKHKQTFNAIRKHLPPGDYGLRADHPTKAKKYIHDFLKEPGFKLSGEKGGAKVLNKKTGKLEHKSFDTLTMTVPKKRKPGSRTTGNPKTQKRLADLLVETDDNIISKELGIDKADDLEKPKPRKNRSKGRKTGQFFEYPVGKEAREKAKNLHRLAEKQGKEVPWFHRASDNTYHRWDNKGGGTLNLINAKTKLAREQFYAAQKKGLTPTVEDYTAVFGKKNGPKLFEAEKLKVKKIYKDYDPRFQDIDHLQSKASSGLHISRNLNPQETIANISEGNRGKASKEIANQLMIDPGGDIRKTIAIQGPELTQELKDQVMGRVKGSKGITNKATRRTLGRIAKPLAKWGLASLPVAGAVLDATVFGSDVHAATRDPSIKNIRKAVGSGAILADQFTPFGVAGQAVNQIVTRENNQRIRGRSGAKKAIEQREDLPYRGLSSSINN